MDACERGLIPFWDDRLVDWTHTDAELSANRLRRKEVVMTLDCPWEGNCTDFFTVFRDGNIFRMYYEAWGWKDRPMCINVCYAESRDGIRWERPNLGICEYNGSTDNNIILKNIPDNFTVMKDPNPDCPPELRYKALMAKNADPGAGKNSLQCLVSADGIHFTPYSVISEGFAYDTQNTLHYDAARGKYLCFIRDQKRKAFSADPRFQEKMIRGICVLESADFEHWSEPVALDFGDAEEYPLYTNVVSAYPYDRRYYVGFPSRYVERKEWTENYDRLGGKEARRERWEASPRYGLAVTDCVFMSSRDGYRWHRFDEAIITPGPENGRNWVYGDCFPACGELLRLPSAFEGEPEELSLYVFENHWQDVPTRLVRYTCRREGFASVKAPYRRKTLRTKLFAFAGDALFINFRTSARGGIRLRILDGEGAPIPGFESCELFGDCVDREVDFAESVRRLSGKPVIFEFELSDAELFALRFAEREAGE
ncbi:MAG: hypothetical protein IKL89_07685 [Clostridia bacterium]|nr:hypothetical protein [Clostridia bacterium]